MIPYIASMLNSPEVPSLPEVTVCSSNSYIFWMGSFKTGRVKNSEAVYFGLSFLHASKKILSHVDFI